MAGEEKKDPPVDQETESKNAKQGGGKLQWIIMVVVVVGCAGAGFGLSNILATKQPINEQTPTGESMIEDGSVAEKGDANPSEKTWFFDEMEGLSASLNNPGPARYVRIKLNLFMSSEITEKEMKELFVEKGPILRDWLNTYLSGLGVDDIRGDKNKRRMQMYMLDTFNEKLFGKKKPLIKQILFEECLVQ